MVSGRALFAKRYVTQSPPSPPWEVTQVASQNNNNNNYDNNEDDDPLRDRWVPFRGAKDWLVPDRYVLKSDNATTRSLVIETLDRFAVRCPYNCSGHGVCIEVQRLLFLLS